MGSAVQPASSAVLARALVSSTNVPRATRLAGALRVEDGDVAADLEPVDAARADDAVGARARRLGHLELELDLAVGPHLERPHLPAHLLAAEALPDVRPDGGDDGEDQDRQQHREHALAEQRRRVVAARRDACGQRSGRSRDSSGAVGVLRVRDDCPDETSQEACRWSRASRCA